MVTKNQKKALFQTFTRNLTTTQLHLIVFWLYIAKKV